MPAHRQGLAAAVDGGHAGLIRADHGIEIDDRGGDDAHPGLRFRLRFRLRLRLWLGLRHRLGLRLRFGFGLRLRFGFRLGLRLGFRLGLWLRFFGFGLRLWLLLRFWRGHAEQG